MVLPALYHLTTVALYHFVRDLFLHRSCRVDSLKELEIQREVLLASLLKVASRSHCCS